MVQILKGMTDDELEDRLDHLERINAKLRRALKRKRPEFQPDDERRDGRVFVEDQNTAPATVTLLVSI